MSDVNPYDAPLVELAPGEIRSESWKAIAQRWEKLRLLYNLVMAVAGGLSVAMVASAQRITPSDVGGAVVYAIAANVCYLLGPITEMYLNWLADVGERRFLPMWAMSLIRSRAVSFILFFVGTAFSVFVTLAIGLVVLVATTFPSQN